MREYMTELYILITSAVIGGMMWAARTIFTSAAKVERLEDEIRKRDDAAKDRDTAISGIANKLTEVSTDVTWLKSTMHEMKEDWKDKR